MSRRMAYSIFWTERLGTLRSTSGGPFVLLLPADVVVPVPPPRLVVALDELPPPELTVGVGLVVTPVVASTVLVSAVESVVADAVCAADREKTEHRATNRKV